MSGSPLEAVAQAMHMAIVGQPGWWDELGDQDRDDYRRMAAAAISTLGLVEEVSVRVGQLVGCVMSRPEAEANPSVAEIVAWRWVSSWKRGAMNGCGCWCFECTNRNAGWHCHGPLCEHEKTEDEIGPMHEARRSSWTSGSEG